VIGIDTNVLVRYLVQDDPAQSSRATRIMDENLSESDPGFISLVTIAETVWVLDRSYGFSNTEIARAIERLLQAKTLQLQNEQEVFTAMVALKAGMADFSDALIGALGRWGGCAFTVTFDKRAARLQGFKLA
jgi:predicted nucleic-acid-binding protein